MFCGHEALTAVEADLKGRKLVEALRRLQASDLAIYETAVAKIEALRDKDTASAYAQRAEKAKARNQRQGGPKAAGLGAFACLATAGNAHEQGRQRGLQRRETQGEEALGEEVPKRLQ